MKTFQASHDPKINIFLDKFILTDCWHMQTIHSTTDNNYSYSILQKKKLKKRETKTKRQNMVLSPQLALYSQSQLDLYMKFAPTLSIYSMSHLDWNKRCKRYLRWKKIVKWKSSWNYMFWHFFMPCFSLPCLSVKPLSQFEAILSFYFLSTKVKKNDNLFY